jgi:hypothetical protein
MKEADADIVCQPGAKWVSINETLRAKGMLSYSDFSLRFELNNFLKVFHYSSL